MADVKSKSFLYQNTVQWQGRKMGRLSAEGKPDLDVATPPEFRGHAGKWTPEDLLVAAVNACIMTTFLFFAEKQKVPLAGYQSAAEGTLARADNKFMFTEIRVRPEITIAKDFPADKVQEIVALADKNCLITSSIKADVIVTPQIIQVKD